MANEEKGRAVLDKARAGRSLQSIVDEDIDFREYEEREERARVISSDQLAEVGKEMLLLGVDQQPGLMLPWAKASGRVKITSGKLALWVGWTHHGKSQMLKQVMLEAIRQTEKVCIASMEEEIREVWCDMGRMAACTQEPLLREINQWIKFGSGKLWFYDQQGTVSAAKIKTVIRYCAERLKITQFVIDSLMMLSVNRDDFDAQSVFVGDLKALAKDTGCTIHLVAHMRKREGKDGDARPGSIHDIAGAHDLASKADYVFNVWRDKERKDPSKPECSLVVEKQRGRINWLGTMTLNFHPASRQFIESDWSIEYLRDVQL